VDLVALSRSPFVALLLTLVSCAHSAPGPGTTTPSGAGASAPAPPGKLLYPGSRVRMNLPADYCRPSRVPAVVAPGVVAVTAAEGTAPTADDAKKVISGARLGTTRSASGPVQAEEFRNGSQWGVRLRGRAKDKQLVTVAIATDKRAFAIVSLAYEPQVASSVDAIVRSVQLDESAPYDPSEVLGIRLDVPKGLEVSFAYTGLEVNEVGVVPPFPRGAVSFTVMAIPAPEVPADQLDQTLNLLIEKFVASEHPVGPPPSVVQGTIDGSKAV